ncbi:FIG01144323: hypothetical protein [hydrothermal vent metagenome]|uniref:Outer membrane porin n=1 Tax=hydrothermal vent metagenome TaxID=652676 RepID=A0A1W1ECV6_9ZZZZ
MLPSLFEAAVLSNTDITNTTLIAAHVTRMTTGGLANAYYTVDYDKNPTGDPMQQPASKLGIHGGYGFGSPHASSGNFDNMGRVALGGDTSTDGVTALAAIYANDNLKLQAWDYIAWDILNAIYLQADYTFNVSETSNVTASAQYINESDIGDAYASKVDTNLFGVKLAGNMGNLSAFAAYSQTDDNDDNYGVVSPWGGAPVFTTGMVTRHEMLPDSSVWKVGVGYKLPEYGIKASAYYAEYTVGNSGAQKILGGTASEWTTKEPGFDIQYDVASIKGLNLRFRGNFPREFTPTYKNKDGDTKYSTDWDEYRFIVNYSF